MRIEGGSGTGRPAGTNGPASPGLLARVLGFAVGALVLVASLVFSVVVFAVLLGVVVVVGAYLWWRTRELRRQIREQMQAQSEARGQAPGQGPFPGRGPFPGGSGPFPGGRGPFPGAPRERDEQVLDGDFIRETPARDDRDDTGGPSPERNKEADR